MCQLLWWLMTMLITTSVNGRLSAHSKIQMTVRCLSTVRFILQCKWFDYGDIGDACLFFLASLLSFPFLHSPPLGNHQTFTITQERTDEMQMQILLEIRLAKPQTQNRSHPSRGQDQVRASGSHRARILSPKCFPVTQKGVKINISFEKMKLA